MQDGNCVPKKVTKICNENILTIDNLVIMIEEFQILGYIFKSCVQIKVRCFQRIVWCLPDHQFLQTFVCPYVLKKMFKSSKMFANIGDLTSNVISSEKNLPLQSSSSVQIDLLQSAFDVSYFSDLNSCHKVSIILLTFLKISEVIF